MARKYNRKGIAQWNTVKTVTDVMQKVRLPVTKAIDHLREKIRENISIDVGLGDPIVLEKDRLGRARKTQRVVTERSKPGEFPRRDTGKLWRGIEGEVVEQSGNNFVGYVGVHGSVDYAYKLEYYMNRSFIRRTLEDEMPEIQRILGSVPKSRSKKKK